MNQYSQTNFHHRASSINVADLDSTGGRGGLPCSLRGQLLTGGLASSGLAGGLLGASHDEKL